MRKALLAITVISLLVLDGCRGSATVESDTTVDAATGHVTETVKASVTIQFGGAAPKLASSGNGNSSGHLTQEVPGDFVVDSSLPPQVTLYAQTDTGYTSSITLDLQPMASTQNPSTPTDSVYSWYLPDTSSLDAWEESVESKTNDQVSISGTTNIRYLLGNEQGTYSITSTIQIPGISSNSTTSSSFTIQGGGHAKCPNAPGCPVQPNPGPDGE